MPLIASAQSTRKQLDDACDELRRSAVKSTYGWGWSVDLQNAAERKNAAPDIDLRVTAATGLVLHLAGKALNNVPHTEAALQAARAMATLQFASGQIPLTGRLLPRPGAQVDSIRIVPDRTATTASLGMLLVLLEANHAQPDPRLTASATRAATWLARQQTAAGGWQSPYPPGGGVKARRLIRLDEPGFRDGTLSLLLASTILARKEYATAADRSIEQLLRLRISDESSQGKRLWERAFTLGGDPVKDIEELPRGVDLVSARYGMETLLGAKLIAPHKKIDDALALAAISAGALRKPDRTWDRRYPLYAPQATAEAAEPADNPEPFDSETFAQLLFTVNGQKAPDQGTFLDTERLAQTLTRLSDRALYATPTNLKAPATRPVSSSDDKSSELPEPVRRAWELLLKVNSERHKT